MKFMIRLCQNDVTTSSGDVISRSTLHSHVREEILGEDTENFLEICYGSGVMQQKVGLGSFLPPLGCMSVNNSTRKFANWKIIAFDKQIWPTILLWITYFTSCPVVSWYAGTVEAVDSIRTCSTVDTRIAQAFVYIYVANRSYYMNKILPDNASLMLIYWIAEVKR